MTHQKQIEKQQNEQNCPIPQELYRLPTDLQLEIFFMLRQTKESQYEILRHNLGNIAMSNLAKHQEVQLSQDQMQVIGSQGYRTALGTHGVSKGTYYYECFYEYPEPGKLNDDAQKEKVIPQVRVGFQFLSHTLNGPVGFSKTGVGIRSVDCSICTERKRLFNDQEMGTENYQSFQIKDRQIIGCLIHIPESYQPRTILPEETEICMEKAEHKKKNNDPHEENEYILIGKSETEPDSPSVITMPMTTAKPINIPSKNNLYEIVPGSFIEFYVDGVLVAKKRDILYGRWYPAISCYNYTRVHVNFGAKNIRIPGYSDDFYCLKGCLLNPFNCDVDKQLNEKYGYKELDIQRILELDNENSDNNNQCDREVQKNSIEKNLQQSNNTTLQKQDNDQDNTLQKQNDDQDLLIKKCLKKNGLIFNRNGIQMRNCIEQLHKRIIQGETVVVDTQQIKEELSKIKNKGFKYLPRQDANPFTILYIPRADADYKQTSEYIEQGIYNKCIHDWISQMYDEKPKKSKK